MTFFTQSGAKLQKVTLTNIRNYLKRLSKVFDSPNQNQSKDSPSRDRSVPFSAFVPIWHILMTVLRGTEAQIRLARFLLNTRTWQLNTKYISQNIPITSIIGLITKNTYSR